MLQRFQSRDSGGLLMMRKRIVAGLFAAATVGGVLVAGAPAATAQNASVAPAAAETAPAPVIADYNGRKINLAEGWQGAESCTELPTGEVRCYDTFAEADADTARFMAARADSSDVAKYTAPSRKPAAGSGVLRAGKAQNCSADYWCVFDGKNYTGRRLQFFDPGTKELGKYDFRDKASSIYRIVVNYPLNYGGASLVDYRSGLVANREIKFGGMEDDYPDLSRLGYPGGGNWDNKADALKIWRG
ncbi:peptidase inhibitor family I36 protein [Streptomyces violascens]|uniref:peptidase inhibitor family I36 protein n=1 Tax=Streptomyces violascens TaxID=67381 RepID=UPI0036909014